MGLHLKTCVCVTRLFSNLLSRDSFLFLAMDETPINRDRDRRVLELYEKVLEVEQRLIPTGLHVFGRASTHAEVADLLRMVSSFDRPEMGVRALTELIAGGLGLASYATLLSESGASNQRMAERERVEAVLSEAIARFLATHGAAAGVSAAKLLNERAGVSVEQAMKVFAVLAGIVEQLETSHEIDSLVRALNGGYIQPGPGADIIQNPGVLPTGRNTHAINPYSVPSAGAVRRAEPVVEALLARHLKEAGRYPASMAMVLWGIDNIKTEGEAVAQVLSLLGVAPRRDAMNRATDVDVIPLEKLARPRIDVVMTVSGIFRDLFG